MVTCSLTGRFLWLFIALSFHLLLIKPLAWVSFIPCRCTTAHRIVPLVCIVIFANQDHKLMSGIGSCIELRVSAYFTRMKLCHMLCLFEGVWHPWKKLLYWWKVKMALKPAIVFDGQMHPTLNAVTFCLFDKYLFVYL